MKMNKIWLLEWNEFEVGFELTNIYIRRNRVDENYDIVVVNFGQ